MRDGGPESARVLLKARPTEAQLADRLSEPVPSGLELYLDREDILDPERLDGVARRLNELRPHAHFAYVVEGPLRSLDGSFFDISVNSEPNRECLRRIARLAAAIGAEAVLVHAVTLMGLDAPFGPELHRTKLEASLPLVGWYVDMAAGEGLIPMLENIPPVPRMREGAYMSSIVGMSSRDLVRLATAFPGLKVTVDLSHARLFLNGLRLGVAAVEPALAPLMRYLSTLDDSPAIEDYLATVGPHLFEVHVSNARGLLEEGLPYHDGDMDLDALAASLRHSVRYLVTETIEPDPNRAIYMREAQRRMESVLRAESEGLGPRRTDPGAAL